MSQERIAKYNIGDITQLNAGGPEMSIKEIISASYNDTSFSGSYRCQWFAGKKLDSGIFPEESLILIRNQGSVPDASE